MALNHSAWSPIKSLAVRVRTVGRSEDLPPVSGRLGGGELVANPAFPNARSAGEGVCRGDSNRAVGDLGDQVRQGRPRRCVAVWGAAGNKTQESGVAPIEAGEDGGRRDRSRRVLGSRPRVPAGDGQARDGSDREL